MENWQVCIGKNTDLSICTTLKRSLEWIMLTYILNLIKKMIQHTEYSIFSNTLVKHNVLKRFLWCCNVVTENFDFVEKNTMNFSNCSKFVVEEPVINLSK